MIQKLTPKKFVTDKDERLVAPNEMILAENVTISEREDGSFSILKPMKGTNEIDKATNEPTPPADWTVVGSVSDDQRGRVYFFVYDDSDDSDSRIMMFDQAEEEWKTVFSDDDNYLNFNKDYPVKGDVLNKAFNQDGVITTALYFTDNYNLPRKINVDRALAGEYTEDVVGGITFPVGSNQDLDLVLSAIKAQPKTGPSFIFETDSGFDANNFKSESFQFACQYIYKDGEESAFSSFSDLAVSPYLSTKNLSSFSKDSTEGNVCSITIPWGPGATRENFIDVAKVRIVARSGNSEPFFMIDEFDPNEDKTRDVGGQNNVKVYDANTQTYRFYNDSYYANISSVVSGKLYDNVPQKAQGQAISGSRLMYSNYTEGYKNFPEVRTVSEITVSYGDDFDLGGDYVANPAFVVEYPDSETFTGGQTAIDTATGFGTVIVDLFDSNAVNWPTSVSSLSDVLPNGTEVSIGFDFDPEGNYLSTSNNPRFWKLSAEFSEDGGTTSGGSYDISFGHTLLNKLSIPSGKRVSFRATYTTSENDTVQDVIDGLKNYLNVEAPVASVPLTLTNVSLLAENVSAPNSLISNGDSYTADQLKVEALICFDAVGTTDKTGTFKIIPYVQRLRITETQQVTISPAIPPRPNSSPGVVSTLEVFNSITGQNIENNAETTNGSPDYILSRDISIGGSATVGTFKHGSTHEFGIVYYDKWGRSGFVNELGSVYVKHPSERAASEGKGSATVKVNITDAVDASLESEIPWATSYQIVYGGSQFSNVMQYTTGGGYVVQEYDGTNNILVTSDHRIFVSLNTLKQFRDQTSTAREYSFTKGDICRVISYKDTAGNPYYPSSSDGGPIEFEVMGVEFLDASVPYFEGKGSNPIQWNLATAQTQGEFLVLKAPRVDSGAVKYDGFDWYSMVKWWSDNGSLTLPTPFEYPDGTAPNSLNYWGAECLIEILTPKKSSETPIYYEIGERTRIGFRKGGVSPQGDHGPALALTQGDVRYRNVTCRTPVVVGGSYNIADLNRWGDSTKALECEQPDETSAEKAWGKGKAHTTFERAATINRYNGITYSEPYADDSSVLSLSSFVPSQANFFDLRSEYGACGFLGTQGDNLLAIQENKVSRLSINKSVLETGTQGGVVALSNKVINNMVAYAGDFGTTNPESVLIRDGISYFVDAERRAIVRISNQGLQVISDKDVKSQVADKIISWEAASGSKTIISGYDAEDDIYYATLSPVGAFDGYTIGYDEKGGFWQGTYTFMPDRYASLKDSFYGFKSSGGSIMHEFSDRNVSNRFFNTASTPVASKIEVVANANPSMVKVFRSLSTESNSEWDVSLRDSKNNITEDLSFRKVEGAFYGDIEGAIASGSSYPTDPNDIYYTTLGKIDSVDTADITFSNSLKGINIPLNGKVFWIVNGEAQIIQPTTHNIASVSRSTSTITLSAGVDPSTPIASGDTILVAQDFANVQHNANKLRDRYAVISAEFTPSASAIEIDSEEIYAINVNFENSPLNDAIGGQ